VKAGEALFYDKNNEDILFVSPVSGELIEIERGARRRIITLKVLADKEQQSLAHDKLNLDSASAAEIKSYLLKGGCWPFIKQRPYDIVANPDVNPKAIFVSGYVTAPLAADLDFSLKGKEAELQAALSALSKLTPGKVHVSVGNTNSPLETVWTVAPQDLVIIGELLLTGVYNAERIIALVESLIRCRTHEQ